MLDIDTDTGFEVHSKGKVKTGQRGERTIMHIEVEIEVDPDILFMARDTVFQEAIDQMRKELYPLFYGVSYG